LEKGGLERLQNVTEVLGHSPILPSYLIDRQRPPIGNREFCE
jgi:hypothetical protein